MWRQQHSADCPHLNRCMGACSVAWSATNTVSGSHLATRREYEIVKMMGISDDICHKFVKPLHVCRNLLSQHLSLQW